MKVTDKFLYQLLVCCWICTAALSVGATQECSGGHPPDHCSCPQPDLLQCSCDSSNSVKTEFPNALDIPSGIRFLLFFNCQFTTLKGLEYTNVELLNIRGSDTLTVIEDGAFGSMYNLKHLDLSYSNLGNLTKTMFQGLDSLKSLHVLNSRLTRIASDAFDFLPSLEKLDLSENTGLELPSSIFVSNSKLQTIAVRKCGLKTIPEAISKASDLRELDVDGNSLEKLENNVFSSLTKLATIGLDNCALQSIDDGAFDGLSSLTLLNMGNNLIKKIHKRHFQAFHNKLETLWLEDNQLQTLSEDVLNWEQVKDVRLGHNPWICDCEIHWIYKLEAKHEDRYNVTCALPESYTNKNLYNITHHLHLECSQGSTNKSSVALAVTIPIIIVCCILIGYFSYQIYKNKRRTKGKSVRYSAVYKDTVESARARPL